MSLYFTKDHEWIRLEGDVATVGITDHAQHALGDIVFAEVPDSGKQLKKGDDAAVVESVKAASDVYAPVSGEVLAATMLAVAVVGTAAGVIPAVKAASLDPADALS